MHYVGDRYIQNKQKTTTKQNKKTCIYSSKHQRFFIVEINSNTVAVWNQVWLNLGVEEVVMEVAFKRLWKQTGYTSVEEGGVCRGMYFTSAAQVPGNVSFRPLHLHGDIRHRPFGQWCSILCSRSSVLEWHEYLRGRQNWQEMSGKVFSFVQSNPSLHIMLHLCGTEMGQAFLYRSLQWSEFHPYRKSE